MPSPSCDQKYIKICRISPALDTCERGGRARSGNCRYFGRFVVVVVIA